MRCLRSRSARGFDKVITSLPNSTIPIKKQHSSDLSAGAVFVSIRVLLFGKIVLCLPLVHRCLPHRAIAPFVEQFPQKERAVAILTFLGLIDEDYCYIMQEWNEK